MENNELEYITLRQAVEYLTKNLIPTTDYKELKRRYNQTHNFIETKQLKEATFFLTTWCKNKELELKGLKVVIDLQYDEADTYNTFATLHIEDDKNKNTWLNNFISKYTYTKDGSKYNPKEEEVENLKNNPSDCFYKIRQYLNDVINETGDNEQILLSCPSIEDNGYYKERINYNDFIAFNILWESNIVVDEYILETENVDAKFMQAKNISGYAFVEVNFAQLKKLYLENYLQFTDKSGRNRKNIIISFFENLASDGKTRTYFEAKTALYNYLGITKPKIIGGKEIPSPPKGFSRQNLNTILKMYFDRKQYIPDTSCNFKRRKEQK